MGPELPATFGKYFLAEKLATGGMAEIYLAKIIGPGGFEKPLVIKQIHPKLSGQRRFVDLFVAEAKTLVTLAHGNIVPVYELGVIDDTYFIAMDYIDGPTLYRLTETLARRDARMEPAIAAWVTARILEGLDYAHRKGEGVIHRDLSPRNVMLSRDGEVKLVDFGIAVPLGTGDDADSGATSPPTGSFPYMSPEQVRREPLTGQTDLFSVGVLAWEMLSGRRLFARSDPDTTLRAVTSDEIPRLSSVDGAIPARLDEVVMRALERDRAVRWPSAGEMLHELQRYLYSLDETPGPRDVAALVARYCPPETRRLPTHADPPNGDSDPPAGPRTARIERPARLPRARTETFAARAELQRLLEQAPEEPAESGAEAETESETEPVSASGSVSEPVSGTEPASDSGAASASGSAATTASGSAAKTASGSAAKTASEPGTTSDSVSASDSASETTASDAVSETASGSVSGTPSPSQRPLPGHAPPNQSLLVILAIGTLIAGAAAIVVFMRGRGDPPGDPGTDPALLGPTDAPASIDAPAPIDAAPASIDAPAPVDAAIPIDAPAPRPPRNGSGNGSGASAAIEAVKPAGDGTLIIGANPWGDILIDGVKRGRTPTTLVVPAGKHTIDVIFGGDDPPRTKRFTIDLKPGASQQLDADFTKP